MQQSSNRKAHFFLEVEVVSQNLSHAAKGLLVMVRVEVLHLNRYSKTTGLTDLKRQLHVLLTKQHRFPRATKSRTAADRSRSDCHQSWNQTELTDINKWLRRGAHAKHTPKSGL